MINFYIKSVSAYGKGKETSTVDFIDGVNIIRGDSDTGKSKIIKSILFAMGASHKPFAKKTGYDRVELVIGTKNGDMVFRRGYSDSVIEISSENAEIPDGVYDTKYNTNRTPVNFVWMRLMGIDGEPNVGANVRSDKKRLTWNNLMRLFYIDEQEICREKSIIEPVQYTEKTLLLSSILYLLYGRDFSSPVTKEEAGIKKKRREAVEEYIQEKIDASSKMIAGLENYCDALSETHIKQKISGVMGDIEKMEQDISEAVKNSKNLLGKILQTEEAIAGCDMLLNRYEVLESQYKADLRRLSFVTEGERIVKAKEKYYEFLDEYAAGILGKRNSDSYEENRFFYGEYCENLEKTEHINERRDCFELIGEQKKFLCPYCKSEVYLEERPEYRKAAAGEAGKTIRLLDKLIETIGGVKRDKKENIKILEDLKQQKDEVEKLIKEQLRPQKLELQKILLQYEEQIKRKTMKESLEEQRWQWICDLEKYQNSKEAEPADYKPKEHFDAEFQEIMDQYAYEILSRMNYPGLVTARFNLKTFDIEVNGGTKVDDHGKGYCAFLNSVVALMFRKYLVEHGEYAPGITIIDSPLHGMFQGVEDDAPESMKTGMFSYLCSVAGEGQLIVAENEEHVPELDYERAGVHEIVFSKTTPGVRHGFLLDVYQ